MGELEVKWKASTIVTQGHKDGLVHSCVTSAGEMHKFALYVDQENRLYRPRWDLTEHDLGRPVDKDVSESFIWFDVLLAPLSRYKKEQGEMKAGQPLMGDTLVLHVRQDRTLDRETVKEFEGVVSDIHWGNLHKSDPETGQIYSAHNPNLGLVKVDVFGSYPRSLMIDTAFNIKKFRRPLAA